MKIYVRNSLSAVVTCVFIYFAYRAARDGGFSVLAHVQLMDLVIAAIVVFAGNNVLGGIRWWALQGYRGSPTSAIRSLSESIFFSTVLPTGSVGGDVYRGVRTEAAAPVIADRVVGGTVTIACAAIALPFFFSAPHWVAIATTPAVLLGLYASWRSIPRVRVGPARVRHALEVFGDVTSRRDRVAPAALLTLGYLLCNTAFLVAISAAVGAHLTWPAALVGSPLVLVSGVVPNVHGLSLVQVSIGAVLFHAGNQGAQAAAAGAAALLITYLFAFGGGLLLLANRLATKHRGRKPLHTHARSEVST